MPEITCPNCREVLDVPAELAGSAVRCGACQFVVEPVMGRVPTVLRAEPARQRERRDELDDTEPPRPKKSLMWLWILLGLGGLSCAGCCGIVGFLGYKVENPTWTKYSAPEGAFTAEFPGDTPQTTTRSIPLPGNTKSLTLTLTISERKLAQERYAVGVCDLPKTEEKLDKALAEVYIEACLKGLANQPGITVKQISLTNMTLFGQPGKEYIGTFTDSGIRNGRVTRRLFVLDNKLYMLSAMGRDGGPPPERVEKFFSSFQPADAKDEKKK
jgi:hypothetical protein